MFIFIAMLLIISLLAYALILKLELRPIIKSNGLVGTLRIICKLSALHIV